MSERHTRATSQHSGQKTAATGKRNDLPAAPRYETRRLEDDDRQAQVAEMVAAARAEAARRALADGIDPAMVRAWQLATSAPKAAHGPECAYVLSCGRNLCSPGCPVGGTWQEPGGDPVPARVRRIGEDNPVSVLTWDEVRAIRERRAEGTAQAEIAIEFGISQTSVSRIVRGVAWREATA